MSARPKWFLDWTAPSATDPAGDGRPWGDGTAMASRHAKGEQPWDDGCTVTPLLGGLHAMSLMAEALQGVIDQASKVPEASRYDAAAKKWVNGHVYIADWRFNCLRDLSTGNGWGLEPWGSATTAGLDMTAIGLVRKLMQAGIAVRLMIWLPMSTVSAFAPHIDDHFYAARLVQAENARLLAKFGATDPGATPLGVVALDMRIGLRGSHHQKFMVIRTPWKDLAFAGGVDIAYTRRDAPVLKGDWQSGATLIPQPGPKWPQESGVDYTSTSGVTLPGTRQPSDLPEAVYSARQSWHDHHLQLEGPAVATLEAGFRERWVLAGRTFDLTSPRNVRPGQVIFSTSAAFHGDDEIWPLPDVVDVPPTGSTPVQMWRTIPLGRDTGPLQRGEFTAMAGIAEAVKQSREIIWMFDQYFWSVWLGRLLNSMLRASPSLHVVIVIPPHADDYVTDAHLLRHDAIAQIFGTPADPKIASRVAIYAIWNRDAAGAVATDRGVYVHAKSHMYDGEFLVCGSANLNRRSFTCDTELALGVADPAVVDAHARSLWAYLFPTTAFPSVDRTTAGWGKQLFDAIAAAARAGAPPTPASRLIADPWDTLPRATLPNGADRRSASPGWWHDTFANNVMDVMALGSSIDTDMVEVGGKKHAPDLADISRRLEREFTVKGTKATFPYRKP